MFLLMVPFAILSAVAQERTITGTVMDGEFKGEPLIGANIIVGEGSSKGTTADMNGHFTLTVLAAVKTITVSYMGYESKTVVLKPNQDRYDVTLYSASKGLGEVVVTGYQQIDRR